MNHYFLTKEKQYRNYKHKTVALDILLLCIKMLKNILSKGFN